MLSNPNLFITLCFSFLASLTYFVYFLTHIYEIRNNKMNKFSKCILLYVFPVISIFLACSFTVYLCIINIIFIIPIVAGGALYACGIWCIFDETPYWGILWISISIIIFAFSFGTDGATKKEENKLAYTIKLYNYTEENKDKEEIFIILKNESDTTSGSNTTSNVEVKTDEENSSDTNDEKDIILYSFKQYNKVNEYDLPFLLQTENYEIIDSENERIEIIQKNIEIYNIYSYFGFSKPTITYEYSCKVFINESSINID